MLERSKKLAMVLAAGTAAALGGVAAADAAKQHKNHTKRHSAAATAGPKNEAALTGTDAQSAKDAALGAVPGGTVERASKEDPSDASGAAFEVHVQKSDGSEVEVLLDSSFKVLSTKAGHGHGGPGDGH